MTENGIYELATEIANRVASACDSADESQRIMHLIRELLEIRWSISPK